MTLPQIQRVSWSAGRVLGFAFAFLGNYTVLVWADFLPLFPIVWLAGSLGLFGPERMALQKSEGC